MYCYPADKNRFRGIVPFGFEGVQPIGRAVYDAFQNPDYLKMQTLRHSYMLLMSAAYRKDIHIKLLY